MMYLLDADTLIRADNTYYPFKRFSVFWDWLRYNGSEGHIKVPMEQFEEVVAGKGTLVGWLKDAETKSVLLLDEEADPDTVADVIVNGYATDLDDSEIEKIGRDPFLISYGRAAANRCVVTFEVSAPSKQRANRKVPDVCDTFGVQCTTLFKVIDALDFTTNWKPPKRR